MKGNGENAVRVRLGRRLRVEHVDAVNGCRDARREDDLPEAMTPTFVGFQTLLDYLEAGDTLAALLKDFPTVNAERAVAALEWRGW